MTEKEEQRLLKLKEIDEELYNNGVKYICGIDEAGRGPLAGPVVVASCIMPRDSMILKKFQKRREKEFMKRL